MAIKDLFEKPQQILTSADAEKTTEGKVESVDNLDAVVRQKEEFVPHIDHTSASNFAIYGSAEKYYEDAIKAIYREYPYDGSLHEKKEFELNLNYLTRYILDKRYPRTNGHITLATNATYNGLTGSYGTVSSNEYIKVVGGPHTASSLQFGVEGMLGKPLYETFKYSNKLDSNPYATAGLSKGQKLGSQLSNLRFDPASGQTVEFWLKKDSFDPTKTKREVVFDLWNNKTMGVTPDSTAGRFLIELTSSDGGPFRLTYRSGSTTLASDLAICSANITGSKVASGGWNHYAVSVKSFPSSNETLVKFYVNGDLDKQTTISGYINEVTGALTAHLGALQTGTNLGGALGAGLLMGSLDEFRYWKEARTSEQIGRNWWTQVHGGSNSETANTTLGVYYKFNEGIVQTSAADSVGYAYDKKILDYSGRVSNGVWVGYPGYGYSARSLTSAMVESNVSATEFKDPILYTAHTDVKALQTELQASGSTWDDQNNASMLNAIPTFMREEDEEIGDGTLTNTLQIMGSYFDKIHHLIGALPKVRATSYLTASAKPYPFATHLLESLGLNAPELFVQANVLESMAQRDEDRKYTQDLTELKNLIYQNIYNNLNYIYKSKGTEKSIRNIVRCFGVDEELIRLNLYASNLTYELKDNIRTKTVKTKSVNFNDVDKFDSTIYQFADPLNANTSGYITGSGPTTVTASLGHEDLLGMTVEAEVIFPIKKDIREEGWFETPFTTVSLFGMHTPTNNGLAFDTKDYANFQVQAIKAGKRSNHAYFKLTSGYDPYPIPELTSSMYTDVYDNQRWNFSVRIKPLDPVTNFVQDNQLDTTFNPLARMCQNYEVHFYGVNMETGYPEHTFHVSGTMEAHQARDFLRSSKKLYAGAHRLNFTGTPINYSDVKVTNVKYWATCLENEDLNIHASDPESYGITDPYKNVSLQVASLNKYHVPKISTLALNWTFNNCVSASSDAADPSTDDSFFFVDDASSGSAEAVTDAKYGWLSKIVEQQHSGKADKFLPPESGDTNPVDVVYLSAARRQLPEVISTADAVQILRQDDDKFTREHSIIQHYYAIEKSMYQTISEEMINMFASIVDFNNLIGEPVNRYRLEYKDLSKLRQLFFERIGNTPDLDKYVEFYKWIDSAVTTVIQALIPASAEVSEELHNMVESHVLERNKYWTKFPTIEFKQDDPEAGLRGVMELTYDWEHGHRPADGKQSSNALYWKERAHRGDEPLSVTSSITSEFYQRDSNPVDGNKNTIRRTLNTHREAKKNSLARPDGTLYGGREYALRKFTKPYKLEMDLPLEIKSGVNFERAKNVDVSKNLLDVWAPLTRPATVGRQGLPTNVMFVDGVNLNTFKDIDDDLVLNRGKRKHTGTVVLGRPQEYEQSKNETYAISSFAKILPGTIVSSSVVSGYNKVFAGVDTPGFVTGTAITNIHHDFYGQDREIPMQGPFTEKYIGGHQSRHVRLNPGSDDFSVRPEAWRILVGKQSRETCGTDPGAFGFVGQDYPYPALGKDPLPAAGMYMFTVLPTDGDVFTISDGDKSRMFQFRDTNSVAIDWTAGTSRTLIDFDGGMSVSNTALATTNAINSYSPLYVTAEQGAVVTTAVTLANSYYGSRESMGNSTLGSKGNIPITGMKWSSTRVNTKGVYFSHTRGTNAYGFDNYDGSTTDDISDRTFTMAMWVSCSATNSDGQGGLTGGPPDPAEHTFDTIANRTFWRIGRDGDSNVNKWLYRSAYDTGDDSLRLKFRQKHVSGDMVWVASESLTASQFGRQNGGWYHIVVSYDYVGTNNYPLVMINGVSASTDAGLSTPASGLGAPKNGTGYSQVGMYQKNSNGVPQANSELQFATIAEMAYWDSALTQTEIGHLYNSTGSGNPYTATTPTTGHFTGPVDLKSHDLAPKYWWRFGDGGANGDDQIADSSNADTGILDMMNNAFTWYATDVGTNPKRLEIVSVLTGSHANSAAIVAGGTWAFTAGHRSAEVLGMKDGADPEVLNYNAPKATRYREELIKRPVSIKNIRQTTASVDTVIAASRQHGPIGNYTHNYEIVQAASRTANDLDFRKTSRVDHENTALAKGGQEVDASTYRRKLLQLQLSSSTRTEADHSVGDPNFWHKGAQGFTHSTRDLTPNSVRTKNKTVIVSRFSAPGGYESMSRGFLDPAHEETSPYDTVVFRNRAVRGDSQYVATSGSVPESFKDTLYQDGELATTFRVVDIHGEPWGLRTHLARYTAPFGRDSVLSHGPVTVHDSDDGSVDMIDDLERPGFHKTHRNRTVLNEFTTSTDRVIRTTTYGVQSLRGINMSADDGSVSNNNAKCYRLVNQNFQGMGGTKQITVAAWIYMDSEQQNKRAMWSLGDMGLGGEHQRTVAANRPICHLYVDANERLHFVVSDPDTATNKRRWYTATSAISADQIHNIILTYDGRASANDPVIYVDGEAKSLTESSSDANYIMDDMEATGGDESGFGIIIGGGPSDTASNSHRTMLDTTFMEFAVWNKDLSATEIAQVYANGMMPELNNVRGGYPGLDNGAIDSIANLVSWWRFGDSAGDPQNNTDLRTSGSYDGVSAIRDVMGTNNVIPLFQENAMLDSQARIDEANIDTTRAIPAAAVSRLVHLPTYTFFTKSVHDNGYVSHQIPRNHANYSWITASLLKGHIPSGLPTSSNALGFQVRGALAYARPVGGGDADRIYLAFHHQTDTVNEGQQNNPVDDLAHIDFVGTNQIIAEPVNTATNTLGHPDNTLMFSDKNLTDDVPQYINRTHIKEPYGRESGGIDYDMTGYILNGIIHHRQGPYGWPSWKQIRGAHHPVVRTQHKKNEFTFVLPDADEIETSSSVSGRRVIRPRYGNLHYWDRTLPLTTKFKPIESTMSISTKMRNSFGKDISKEIPVDINTTYGNELVFFNREGIDKELDLSRTKAAAYEEVKDMFTRGALETSLSPITSINKFVYKEVVYPAHQNMYSGDIRIKKGYTQNFWRSTHAQRTAEQPKTIHGLDTYGRDKSFDGVSSYTHFGENSRGRPSMSLWPLDHATGAMNNYPISSYKAVFAHGDDHSNQVGKGEGELQNRWSWPIKFHGGTFTYGTGYPTSSVWSEKSFTNAAGSTYQGNRLHPEATACFYMPHMLHATSSITSPTGLPLVNSTASMNRSQTIESIISNSTASFADPTTLPNNPAQQVDGIRITDRDGRLKFFTDIEWRSEIESGNHPSDTGTQEPIVIMNLHKTGNWAGFVPMQGGYTAWQAASLAGKMEEFSVAQDGANTARAQGVQTTRFVTQSSAPWHEDYEEFYNDIRVKAKDYSVLPEFRMEDHIADYVTNKGGDFLHEQNSMFRMVGLPSGSLGGNAANSAESDFYKVYGTSDFLKHFDVLKNDIEEHFEPSALTLQCNAIIKFNPYDGFYPAQRTLQMASQFSASYGRFVDYSGAGLHYEYDGEARYERDITQGAGETAGIPTSLAFRNFLSPLFAPGIMFNTIKAGVACDWPVMTDGIKIYKTRAGKSDYWGLGFKNPEQDDGLHNYLEDTYGSPTPANIKKVKKAYFSTSVLNHGIFKIREDLRKSAIRESLIVASASIAGLADGYQVIEPQAVYGFGDESTEDNPDHGGGFYATKINVADLPGMKETTYTMNLTRDENSLAFRRISITASAGPGPNLGRWDKRIPFEAIVNPENFLKNIELYDYISHPSCSMDITASWQGQGDNLYSLMANNFCAAVPDFFLQNSQMTTISSRPQDELNLYAKAGNVYGMRIKMYRSLNRERNYSFERATPLRSKKYDVPQDPRDDIGLHETFTMYSRASAFGPPVFGRVHCVRMENSDYDHDAGSTPPNEPAGRDTAAQAIALGLTASYNLERGHVFSDTGNSSFTRCGTQLINETIFHTSSYLAGQNGALDSIEGYYWSHTPPYYHGEAWCDVLFKPTQTKTYSLAEIVDQVEIVQYRVDPGFNNPTGSSGLMDPQYIPNGYHSSSLYSAENINANAMQIDSSVNLLGIGKVRAYAYNNVGASGQSKTTTLRRTIGDSPAWIIQPKFETPMLNFNSLTAEQGGTCPRPLTDDLLETPVYGSEQAPRGIWHQFGTIPQGNEGVWMEVGDIPASWLNNHPMARQSDSYAPSDSEGSGSIRAYRRAFLGERSTRGSRLGMKSLSDLVGMDTTPKRLGTIKETTTVYEAVVAVPFIEKENQRWFFTLDPHMVDIALGEESYRLQDGSDQPGQSIEDQIRKMQKYVFPPTFDFLNNRDLPAIAMYIFEFSMTFNKDDLSYMWQNLMPTKAGSFEMASSTINHNLLINELMGYANKKEGLPMKDKIQWMVFKVKQKAPVNYYDKIVAKTPELDKLSAISRSRQVSLGNNADARYSYNWPYDCFSIVEMAQIEATVEFAALPSSIPGSLRVDSSGGRPSKQGRYGLPLLPNQTPAGLIQSLARFGGSSGEGGSSVAATTGVQKLGTATFDMKDLGSSGKKDDVALTAVLKDPATIEKELGGILADPLGAGKDLTFDQPTVKSYQKDFDVQAGKDYSLDGFGKSSGPIYEQPAQELGLNPYGGQSYDFGSSGIDSKASLRAGVTMSEDMSQLSYGFGAKAIEQTTSGIAQTATLATQTGGISQQGQAASGFVSQGQIGQTFQQTQVQNQVAQQQSYMQTFSMKFII